MASMKRITSKDVAKAAGVSQATVSMILNNKDNVSFSKETVEKVIETSKRMNYHLGKLVNDNKSKQAIAVIFPSLTNPYYSMLIESIEKEIKEKGYSAFLCNTQRNLSSEEKYLEMLVDLNIAGIVYACNPSFPKLIQELSKNIPTVIIGDKNEELSVDSVELNSIKPGMIMAEHLISLGHKKVAFVSNPVTERQPARRKRIEGFKMKFEECGLGDGVIVKTRGENYDLEIQKMDTEYLTGYELTKEIIRDNKDVTAIVGTNDMVAIGIMDALIDNNYKIPGDYSVMGCDNTLISGTRRISLTTVEHYIDFKGKDACDILFRKIESVYFNEEKVIPPCIYRVEYEPKLIIRSTTAINNDTEKNNK